MFNTMFGELKEVKYRFHESYDVKYFQEIKRLKSLQKAEVYLETKQTSMMELYCEYI